MHQQAETVPFSRRSKIVRAVLFVLLGIPGTIVFTLAVVAAIISLVSYGQPSPLHSPAELAVILISLIGGGICLLIGSGGLKQWPYLAVFIVFGVSFFCFAFFLLQEVELSLAAAAVMAYGVSYLIRRFYALKSK